MMFIVNKLGPFEKSFHKLGLCFNSINNKSTRPSPLCIHQFGNPDETLTLAYEILLLSPL